MKTKLSEFELTILNAIEYIEEEKNESMFAYSRTIVSFLRGAKSSPFFLIDIKMYVGNIKIST